MMGQDLLPTLSARPVLIVGAGRSGTNMLRDVLDKLASVGTWPCDEINYIWRHGNRGHDTDELVPSHASPTVKKYIRNRFNTIVAKLDYKSTKPSDRIILEKTCANSLRIEYVKQVLPEAKYIFLVRDGRDVVPSAVKRWKAPLDIGYLIAKARFVPLSDLPYYASRYFLNRLAKLKNPEARLSVWGPRFEGWRSIVSCSDLSVVCAHQWVRCLECSLSAFSTMPAEKVYFLKYEDFVFSPHEHVRRIAEFLELPVTSDEIVAACSDVSSESVGNGSKSEIQNSDSLAIMVPMLKELGYKL